MFYNGQKKIKTKDYLYELFFTFIFGSFLGFLFETLYISVLAGQFVDRGILTGPLCPIYGFGAMIIRIIGRPKKTIINNVIYFFICCFGLGAFELISGYFIKWIFKVELWNYTKTYTSILNYVSVESMFAWGILAILYINFIHPYVKMIAFKIPKRLRLPLVLLIVVLLIVDIIFSMVIINNNPDYFEKMVHPY